MHKSTARSQTLTILKATRASLPRRITLTFAFSTSHILKMQKTRRRGEMFAVMLPRSSTKSSDSESQNKHDRHSNAPTSHHRRQVPPSVETTRGSRPLVRAQRQRRVVPRPLHHHHQQHPARCRCSIPWRFIRRHGTLLCAPSWYVRMCSTMLPRITC